MDNGVQNKIETSCLKEMTFSQKETIITLPKLASENCTMEIIPECSFPLRLISESRSFYWYCHRNEGFKIFRCDFSEKFLFLSQKNLSVFLDKLHTSLVVFLVHRTILAQLVLVWKNKTPFRVDFGMFMIYLVLDKYSLFSCHHS